MCQRRDSYWLKTLTRSSLIVVVVHSFFTMFHHCMEVIVLHSSGGSLVLVGLVLFSLSIFPYAADSCSHVLIFRCVNIIAVRKICKKHDRLLSNRMLGDYYHKQRKQNVQAHVRPKNARHLYSEHNQDQPQFGVLLSKPVGLESTRGYILGICE